MSEMPSDTPPEQNLAPRPEGDATPAARNWFTKTLAFVGDAVIDEAERSRGYKLLSYVLNIISLIGLVVSTTVGYIGPWPLWLALFVIFLMLSILNAVRNYHERAVAGLEKDRRELEGRANEGEALRGELAAVTAERSAIQKQLEDATAEIAESKKYKVLFEVDERASRVHLQERPDGRVVVLAEIRLRFENKDIYPWSMKALDMTLHDFQAGKEIYTLITAKYSSNGVDIKREQFEGMLIQGGRVTPFYLFEVIMMIHDDAIKAASDLKGVHHLRITMEASNQPPFKGELFLSWENAQELGGTPLTITFGAPAIDRVSHRLD